MYFNLISPIILIVGYDLWFYFVHRAFHTKLLYKYHKIHHTHGKLESKQAVKAHIVEDLVTYFGSFYIYIIFNKTFSIKSLIISNAYTSIRGYIQHSPELVKYRIIQLVFGDDHHVIHHEKFNYNFSQKWIDDLFGTTYKKNKIECY